MKQSSRPAPYRVGIATHRDHRCTACGTRRLVPVNMAGKVRCLCGKSTRLARGTR